MDFFKLKKAQSESTTKVSIQREGNRQIKQISEAVSTVPWGISMLSLAWTAGPVTLFAAQISYLLGYNKAPTQENLIFFFVYTVITGIAGIVAQITYKLTQGKKVENQKQQVSMVLEQLPELRWQVLDLHTHQLTPEQRTRYVAKILLQKVELDPESLKQAVFDLTSNKAFARLLSQIEIYRQVGMDRRIDDLTEAHHELITNVIIGLEDIEPDAIPMLRMRLQGDSPDQKTGMPRHENFIERVFSAIEEENDLLMNDEDVEEMIVLVFELLCGRKIPTLTFSYSGRWELASALDRLETERSKYRIAQATGLSRIRSLTSYINNIKQEYIEIPHEEHTPMSLSQSADLLVEQAELFLDKQADLLTDYCAQSRKNSNKVDKEWVKHQSEILSNSIQLWKEIRKAYSQLGKQHELLLKASDHWDKYIRNYSDNDTQLQLGRGNKGLRIKENIIELDAKAKAEICATLANFLSKNKLTPEDQNKARQTWLRGRVTKTTLHEDHITPELAKQLAIEIALVLEPYIHLSRPEIQRAIYSTHGSYMNDIEPGMSAATKIAMGSAMADEKRKDLSIAAERLALALVKHYQVNLEEEAIIFLRDTYQARESRLNMINQYSANKERKISYLTLRPPAVAAPKRGWYTALIDARRIIS